MKQTFLLPVFSQKPHQNMSSHLEVSNAYEKINSNQTCKSNSISYHDFLGLRSFALYRTSKGSAESFLKLKIILDLMHITAIYVYIIYV